MPYSETVVARIRAAFAGRDGICEMKMFGGVAFLHCGNLCCGVVFVDPPGFASEGERNVWLDRCETYLAELPPK